MATITSIGSGTSTANTATVATSATVTAAIGDWIVAVYAGANNVVTVGAAAFSDSAGNVYTNRVASLYTPGAVLGDGAVLVVATAPVTSTLSGGTVTFTAPNNIPQKAIQVYRVHPDVGEPVAFVSASNIGLTGAATNHAAPSVSVANSQIIFGAAAIETNDSITGDTDTTNGSWSAVVTRLADGGTDDAAMSCVSQYKTVNATGAQNWSCATLAARDSCRSYLILSSAAAAYSVVANQGSYALSGTVATMRLGGPPMVAGPGSYALTGTAASPLHGWMTAAAAGSYALTGTAASQFYGRDLAATAGSYLLTGSMVTLTASNNKLIPADPGTYVLTGTDANLLHGWLLAAAAGSYALTGSAASPLQGWKLDATVGGSYVLTGTTVALNAATGNKTLLADPGTYLLTGTNATLSAGFMVAASPGSYLLTGTAATLQASVPAAPPIRAIGEPPIARDQRRRREAERARALEQQRKARDRLKRAIGRLLEGLPPEFDEPEQLAEAEVNAVQAFNLLRAMRAPAPELDAVSELISTIQAMRIAQPIVQLELARAYNHSHRHLKQKAQEDVVMTLLLGE